MWMICTAFVVFVEELRMNIPRDTIASEIAQSQRVQVPNILGLWSQKPLRVGFLGPESLNVGYLDPLGI